MSLPPCLHLLLVSYEPLHSFSNNKILVMAYFTRAVSANVASTNNPSVKTMEEDCSHNAAQSAVLESQGKSIRSLSLELNTENPIEIGASSSPLGASKTIAPTSNFRNSSTSCAELPHQSSYISPQQRRLGTYQNQIEHPHAFSDTASPMDFELRKFVGLIIKSSAHTPAFSSDYLEKVSLLAENFMNTFCSTLRKLTDLQRHTLPGFADLELCTEKLDITPGEIYQEYLRNNALPDSTRQHAADLKIEVELMLKDYYAEKYDLDKDDPSLVFYTNEQYEIATLIPQEIKTRDYIPDYFPELPPDFTYRLTGSYMHTMTELKKIKMKLFEESRLNEASLYKLIDDDEKRWHEELNEQLGNVSDDDSDNQNEDIMSVNGDHASDIDTPIAEVEEGSMAKKDLSDETEKKGEEDNNSTQNNAEIIDEQRKSELNKDGIQSNKAIEGYGTDLVEEIPTFDEKPGVLVPSGVWQEAAQTDTTGEPVQDYFTSDNKPELRQSSESHGYKARSSLKELQKTSEENHFNIVEYAHKRRKALERPQQELTRHLKLRAANFYLQAEEKFSCYATDVPTEQDFQRFNKILSDSFRNVIRATRCAQKRKEKKLAILAAEQERLNKVNEQLHGTLEFAFKETANFLDESDDNKEDEQTIDFDDPVESQSRVTTKLEDNSPEEESREKSVTPILPDNITRQTSDKLPTKGVPAMLSMEVDSGDIPESGLNSVEPDDNNNDNLEDMLEELELLPATTWDQPSLRSDLKEDESEASS